LTQPRSSPPQAGGRQRRPEAEKRRPKPETRDPETANGTLVELWTCNGGANQQWLPVNGMLVNPVSGRCLDDPAFTTTNGTQLDIWDCNGGSNQQWAIP